MRKKILVKEAGLMNFIRSFFKAKSSGQEKEYIKKLKKVNPDLGKAWEDWDSAADDLLNTIKQRYIKQGKLAQAAEVDKIINQYK